MPKSYSGRPQHKCSRGTLTSNPNLSSTSVAACATSGWKWLLKVSAQRITLRPLLLCSGREKNHDLKVRGANCGILRWDATPAANFARCESPGVWVARFTIPGQMEASRAHLSIQPNAYACRGRNLPSQ